MPHFKDHKGALYWLDDHDADAWKKPDWTEIDDAEAAAIRVAQAPKPNRRDEITHRLSAIDLSGLRALRAVARGRAVKADTDKLDALDAEADALRAELVALGPA